MKTIPRELADKLVSICDKKGVMIASLCMVHCWPGKCEAISRIEVFVLAAAMSAHFRFVYEGNGTERKDADPYIGDALKAGCFGFGKYAPGMMSALQGHTITDGMRNIVRQALFFSSLRSDQSESAQNIIDNYGLLALWAAKTVFPASELVQGAQGQVQVAFHFAKEFNECFSEWKEELIREGIVDS